VGVVAAPALVGNIATAQAAVPAATATTIGTRVERDLVLAVCASIFVMFDLSTSA